MNFHAFDFHGTRLHALGSGALHWPEQDLLVVSDLHLGKSERIARRSRQLLPPYETSDTLMRLEEAISQTAARQVICLGDSFDDLAAGEALPEAERLWLTRLMAGRHWVWIEGNHDPGPLDFGGTHLAQLDVTPLMFRHIAEPGGSGEVSGHYHPKLCISLRGRLLSRPGFLVDRDKIILPAFGTYTGGLRALDDAFSELMGAEAYAIMTGPRPCAIPWTALV